MLILHTFALHCLTLKKRTEKTQIVENQVENTIISSVSRVKLQLSILTID